jgi:hypothetical protein
MIHQQHLPLRSLALPVALSEADSLLAHSVIAETETLDYCLSTQAVMMARICMACTLCF